MKKIIINEYQFKKLFIPEGVEWSTNDDGSINFSVNSNSDDKSNTYGNMSVDTRVFGNKNDILYGDGTSNGKSLYQKYNEKSKGLIQFYDSIIEYIKNGRNGIIKTDNVPSKSITSVKKWFEEGKSDNYIIHQALKLKNRAVVESNPITSTYNRVSQQPEDKKIERYITGIVPETDIKYIALFSMKDFNFSDAIKHGQIRPNSNTDLLLNINKSDRDTKDINVYYDGNIKPNIEQNFSLYNVPNQHFKQQYQYQNGRYNTSELTATDLQRELNKTKTYTSVNQFIDKSIIYAAHALKKENFIPTFIISAPSSSKFNNYYCINLSRKLNIEYIPDFFQRNAINVKFDNEKDEELMRQDGIPQKEIDEFKEQIKLVAFKEIMYYITVPFETFVNKYKHIFSEIANERYSRNKLDFDVFKQIMLRYVINTIKENYDINQKFTSKYILDKLYSQKRLYQIESYLNQKNNSDSKYNSQYILNEFSKLARLKGLLTEFNNVLKETYEIAVKYSDILEKGYKIHGIGKITKITHFKKHLRKYINKLYVVADEHLTNGNLQKRYANAKFLIFDEDINSGATLKLAIDALEDKLPAQNHNNILCLVNGYSASGF